jgi:hypothetical protein
MLVQFRFKNFKSFKDEACLSLVSSNYYKDLPQNLIPMQSFSLLRGAVVFGANASGKTKLFQAVNFMRQIVRYSAKNDSWKKLFSPFKLSVVNESSLFEVIFIHNSIQYRYGFEIKDFNIKAEWLFRKKAHEVQVFYRDGQEVNFNSRYISHDIASNLLSANMITTDTLFISALSRWNDALSISLLDWFQKVNVLSASVNNFAGYSVSRLDSPMKSSIVNFLKYADTGIIDLSVESISIDDVPDDIKRLLPNENIIKKVYKGVRTIHTLLDENHIPKGTIELSMENDESYGTYRIFALSAPIIDTLKKGNVLFIDEIDNGLHRNLLYAIIALFNNPKINVNKAQLVINTHNTSLIDKNDIYRRDQIYLVSKNQAGESLLTPLSDFKLRESAKIGNLYKDGRLGGIPYLEDFDNFIISNSKENDL